MMIYMSTLLKGGVGMNGYVAKQMMRVSVSLDVRVCVCAPLVCLSPHQRDVSDTQK
jgi:hypothetical protein